MADNDFTLTTYTAKDLERKQHEECHGTTESKTPLTGRLRPATFTTSRDSTTARARTAAHAAAKPFRAAPGSEARALRRTRGQGSPRVRRRFRHRAPHGVRHPVRPADPRWAPFRGQGQTLQGAYLAETGSERRAIEEGRLLPAARRIRGPGRHIVRRSGRDRQAAGRTRAARGAARADGGDQQGAPALSRRPPPHWTPRHSPTRSRPRSATTSPPTRGSLTRWRPYQLTNSSANIRRIRNRIEQLQRRPAESTESQVQVNVTSTCQNDTSITVREDVAENRVMLIFPGKPAENVRTILKASGFKWSPTRGAWVRFLNNAGRAAAQYVISKINGEHT